MSDHDDRWFDDPDLDAGERILAARLTAAMAGQAGTIVLADEPFDPGRPAALDLGDDAPARQPTPASRLRGTHDPALADPDGVDPAALEALPITPAAPVGRGWVVWVAGVAAAAVLVAAIVMIDAVRQPSLDVGDDPAPTLVGTGTGWAPTWVPDGLELWDLQVQELTEEERLGGTDPGAAPTVQQLVVAGSTRLFVAIGAADRYLAGADSSLPDVQVRGLPGRSTPVRGGDDASDGVQLVWEEAGQTFAVTADGADPGAAIALLDRLELADPADPGAGFRAPADGSAAVRTDDDRAAVPGELPIAARFGYSAGQPASEVLDLTISTVGPWSGRATSSMGPSGYLYAAFRGEVRPDGVALSFSAGRPSQGPPSVQAVWPDGRTVYASGTGLDRASAERIVLGVEAVPATELEQRAGVVSERLGSGEVLARAELPSATVEVIGAPGPGALCLTVEARRQCSLRDRMAGPGGSVPAPTQFGFGTELLDGRWYLFGANEGPVDVTVELGADSGTTTGTGPPDPSVQAETATDGTWTVALLVVPDGFDRATIASPDRSMNLARPVS